MPEDKLKIEVAIDKEVCMEKVRIGFIGCGFHSTENLYPCLRYITDRADLVAVCEFGRGSRQKRCEMV